MTTRARFCVFMILALPLSIVFGCGGGGSESTPVSPTTYTISGTVSGLTGTGLVLEENGGNNLALSTNGAFTFSNSVASGAAYSVTVSTQPTGQSCIVTNGSSTATANVTNVQVSCTSLPPSTYTIGGTVSGLTGTGLVLQNNGGNNLALSTSSSFTFSTAVASGAAYSVTVFTQPTGQSCTVTSGSGTATANVTNVQVVCSNLSPTTYTVGGIVSGLIGTGLVVQNNGGNNQALSANGTFAFSNSVASGATYSVTVLTQPTGQSCTVTNGSGTANSNVTSVQVACLNLYSISGTVSGLTGSGLVLQNNGSGNLAVSVNGAFVLPNHVASGSAYSVTVFAQPTGQSCTVTNGSGTATANITNVQVACANNTFTIGGTVSGLTGTGLVVQDNGGNNQALSANGTFAFSNSVASGVAYSVTVLTQPTGQSCTVTNGNGTANANVTNVQIACSNNTYTIGGTISGLTGTGLILQDNGGTNLAVSASGSFTFSTAVASGTVYSVTVLIQPVGQSCTVTNGSGTASANVTNVQIACSNFYTIGGTVSGLTGTGLVLRDNGGNNLALSANGSFTFSSSVAGGATYSVTVFAQPTGQSCAVTNGSGAASVNVTNVQVACSNNTYTIGGTVSGLTGAGLVVQDNGGNNLALSANGSFTFSNSVVSGAAYSVTVFAQPTGESCTITNGSGTASANITNVQVACSTAYYSIGGTVSGLTGTGLVLQDDGVDNLAVSANGSFVFASHVGGGVTYSVAVLYQPTGQSCTVTNGSGTASANVTNVQVICSSFYTIGGTVSGLTGTGLVLQDNGGNNLSVSTNGAFTFSNSVASGATYSATVLSQPTGESCTVTSGSGTASTNVTNIQVTCSSSYTIGGTVSGLAGTGGLVLQNNGGNNLSVSANGVFTFLNSVASGAAYSVTVFTQPTGQICAVTNGSGTASANVTAVQVACVGAWTWMGGSNTGYQSGVYGYLGTPASTNIPGGRSGAVSWSDASGNLWLFGGSGFDASGAQGELNDLWKFDPSLGATGEWTWMGGSSTLGSKNGQPGVYGTLGTAASTNIPGGRSGAVSWSDASGNLWLFGGSGFDASGAQGELNDLWKFDPKLGTNGEWTWMGGSSTVGSQGVQPGVYGYLGTPASTNMPGGRVGAISWSDASGNLWLFGGTGLDFYGVGGDLNDLWKFDPSLGATGEWTWMGGGISNSRGYYGTLGTAGSTNFPGSRGSSTSWIDSSGNLWLFGGGGYDSTGTVGDLNDLWKFDPALGTFGEWTWMGGSSTSTVGSNNGQSGVYGTVGTAASTNIPGGRISAMTWSDASGNLWLFGGQGYDWTGVIGDLNDLWKFEPALGTFGEWTWMGGSSTVGSNNGQPGVYGTLGTAALSNIPGGRASAVRWSDASGNLWLFGGDGVGSTGALGDLNDLWEYRP